MEKFNGEMENLCKEEHDLQLEFDKSDDTFFAYCKKCGFTPEPITGGQIDELFI